MKPHYYWNKNYCRDLVNKFAGHSCHRYCKVNITAATHKYDDEDYSNSERKSSINIIVKLRLG